MATESQEMHTSESPTAYEPETKDSSQDVSNYIGDETKISDFGDQNNKWSLDSNPLFKTQVNINYPKLDLCAAEDTNTCLKFRSDTFESTGRSASASWID